MRWSVHHSGRLFRIFSSDRTQTLVSMEGVDRSSSYHTGTTPSTISSTTPSTTKVTNPTTSTAKITTDHGAASTTAVVTARITTNRVTYSVLTTKPGTSKPSTTVKILTKNSTMTSSYPPSPTATTTDSTCNVCIIAGSCATVLGIFISGCIVHAYYKRRMRVGSPGEDIQDLNSINSATTIL